MDTCAREYQELFAGRPWAASEMYHEQSKLTGRRAGAFLEQMADFERSVPPGRPQVRRGAATIRLLPVPRRASGPRLTEALRRRRSWRGPFGPGAVGLPQLGTLLQLGFGACGEPVGAGPPLRCWPSAGALYPLELYAIALRCEGIEPGAYAYSVPDHALASTGPVPGPEELRRMILLPGPWPGPALFLVLTGVFARVQRKYGERGYRFLLLEAGHAAQNILLLAGALKLSVVPLGGFCEDLLGRCLGLDARRESPIYVLMLGCPPPGGPGSSHSASSL